MLGFIRPVANLSRIFSKRPSPCQLDQIIRLSPGRLDSFLGFSSFQMEDLPSGKRLCKRIGTHNGKFHCDEALACYMLKRLEEYKDAKIVRTRNQKILDECDIVVDVGGSYNSPTHRYDHHHRSFNESMYSLSNGTKKWRTKLSSAGLVYYHFGQRVVADVLGPEVNENTVNLIYDQVYGSLIEEIDGIDNGINAFDGDQRYSITTTVSHRVGRLNPKWNEEEVNEDDRFVAAMELVGSEFCETVRGYYSTWLPARSIIEQALDNKLTVDKSGNIIILETVCPWQDHLFKLEVDSDSFGSTKYVLYEDKSNETWRVQAVPVRPGSFENRLSLPEEWRGLRDEELSVKSGIPNCIFVHATGFIGGNKTKEGALQMAKRACAQSNH